jgi:hypothetical protein
VLGFHKRIKARRQKQGKKEEEEERLLNRLTAANARHPKNNVKNMVITQI